MKTITAVDLNNILGQQTLCLIDVREPAEHRNASIHRSYLIPLGSLSLEKLPTTSGTIVMYCHAGVRSVHACQKLLREDSALDVYSLEGGIAAWERDGFPVKNLSKNQEKIPGKLWGKIFGTRILPLDRQTQFSVGFLSFSSVMLGTFIHPGFYIIPGFMGAGMMFAGLTGWCGLAKLLARMPWNQ
jgi:rhodanese-related sulfurtransferase